MQTGIGKKITGRGAGVHDLNRITVGRRQIPAETVGVPQAMAVSGIHRRVVAVLREQLGDLCAKQVLDVGAGRGALSHRLSESGCRVSACDLYPDMFEARSVQCLEVDANGRLPYADQTFDAVLGVELLEHIQSHSALFAEIARVLRPTGVAILTTPNVLSLKSRLSFLLTGYCYSFGPLDPDICDPVSQHISPLSLDIYRWHLARSGLDIVRVATDRQQTTSRLLLPLWPLVKLSCWIKHRGDRSVRAQNSFLMLAGRTLMIVASHSKQQSGRSAEAVSAGATNTAP